MKAKIESICLATAEKLKNIDPFEINANPFSLDLGYPGLIIFFSEMHRVFPTKGWNFLVDDLVKALDSLLIDNMADFSLFSGFTAIAFAIHWAAINDSKHTALDEHCLFLLTLYMEQLIEDKIHPIALDSVNGIPSFIFYLLFYLDNPNVIVLLERLLTAIVEMTENRLLNNKKIPLWYLDPHDIQVQQSIPPFLLPDILKNYSAGYCETGLAHGISGSLAALTKALRSKIEVKNHRLAMRIIIEWLLLKQGEDGRWSRYVGINQREGETYFDGWAHGAPGILNTLFFAFDTLNDDRSHTFRKNASQLFERIMKKNTARGLPFCYGLAGVAVIFNHLYELTREVQFEKMKLEIINLILLGYFEENPYGFKSVAPSFHFDEASLLDSYGLLTGSAGIVLSLLAEISEKPPLWPSIFLVK